ncbi:hypothetical protein, partial [Enterobacter hormaechei]|uniref:hypothetical protein n=1 Tax=Enterobacter hormaechei TaxID=158836 RepID=UPI001BD5A261
QQILFFVPDPCTTIIFRSLCVEGVSLSRKSFYLRFIDCPAAVSQITSFGFSLEKVEELANWLRKGVNK